MRKQLVESLIIMSSDERFVFLTGDLGFGAFEPLKEALGDRFINAGVAEQNMVSVAAGLARNGMKPWVYSIAPFLYLRALEQIRNDICFHNLPVTLVGNGGGYGYGVMGATHHAIEDYGILSSIQDLKIFIPAFKKDVNSQIAQIYLQDQPSYIRLGNAEKINCDLSYKQWRMISVGSSPKWVILSVGPLTAEILEAINAIPDSTRPTLWCLSKLPIPDIDPEFIDQIEACGKLLVVEEHIYQGSVGQAIGARLLKIGIDLDKFITLNADHACYYDAGSQKYLRKHSLLSAETILGMCK